MLIKEFRVVLPFTVDEYRVGQLYSVAKTSSQETSNGEGVEVLVNEPYKEPEHEGQYTHKIYHLGARLPGWIRALIPSSALKLEEKAWNAYPYCKTILKSPFLGEKFTFIIESRHAQDNATTENIHNLSDKDLKERTIEVIDISKPLADPKKDYKAEEDPTLVKSEKANRGPLEVEKWRENPELPIMTCYKLVTVEFKMFGFQTKVENFMMKIEFDLFTKFHRQVYCWLDDWFGMSMDDVRAFELKTKEDLKKKLESGKDGKDGKDAKATTTEEKEESK